MLKIKFLGTLPGIISWIRSKQCGGLLKERACSRHTVSMEWKRFETIKDAIAAIKENTVTKRFMS